MDNDIKVSVIVITYNHEKFIKQALDSILMQKVDFKYEILIGDDASTDSTPEILNEYKKLYPDIINLYLNSVNLGATRNAYNLLISAKGKYLASCEGDDYWSDKYKLRDQINFLERNKEFIGCCHKFNIVNEKGNICKGYKINWVKFKTVFDIYDFDGIKLPSHVSTFVRKNIFLDKKKDYTILYKSNRMISDRVLYFLYLTEGKIFTLNKVMSCYRLHNLSKDNITIKYFKFNDNKILEELKILLDMEIYYKKTQNKKIFFDKRKGELFIDAILSFFLKRNIGYIFVAGKIYKETNDKFQLIIFSPYRILIKLIRLIKRSL